MPIATPPPELLAAARDAARAHSLAPELVCAVVEQESGWNRWALRYEPGFYERYVEPLVRAKARPGGELRVAATAAPHGALDETEARARAFSWGLMQVMGQVAREHGFAGASLAELCEPAAGLEIGCRVLAAKLAAARGNVEQALLLWNGGSNREYAGQVLARVARYAACFAP